MSHNHNHLPGFNHNKESVALSSVGAGLVLTLGKLIVGLLTGSLGIISEAAHSALDLGAAILTYFAVRVSDKPADTQHHFGHGKTESVSALIETGLLFLTSAWIIYESIKRLISHSTEIEVTWYAFAIVIISIIIDFSRSRALAKVAKATKSQALEADALHFSSDIWSSAVILLGLVFVSLGYNQADALAALVVAIFVILAGYRLGKRTIDVLIDAAPAGVTERIFEIANQQAGVLAVERLRVRPAGAAIFIDLTVGVNRRLPQIKVEQLKSKIESEIKNDFSDADISVLTKSLALDSETIAEKIKLVADNFDVAVHDISAHSVNEKIDVSFDLEISDVYTVGQAHQVASLLESEIVKELGENIVINTHIEPVDLEVVNAEVASGQEVIAIEEIFKKVIANLPLVKNFHKLSVKKFGENYFVTIHITFDNQISLAQAHEVSSRLEYLIRQAQPVIKRVVVHNEPAE
ncbi:MAG: cation diffusion facilitator family transporter [Candidatus Buchananbacteria bacterium]